MRIRTPEQKQRKAEAQRARIAADPDYYKNRYKKRSQADKDRLAEWRKNNPEKQKGYDSKRPKGRKSTPEYLEKARVAAKTWNKKNPEKVKQFRQNRVIKDPDFHFKCKLRHHYGMTFDKYISILESQGGVCKICKNKPENKLCVDHDHETGEVRGLLCATCNTGLGYFYDNPELLRGAINYLELNEKIHQISQKNMNIINKKTLRDKINRSPILRSIKRNLIQILDF